jgi:predicted HicB family RNase H-like nuclease
MNYRGCEAVVEFDEEDRLFTGRVINTADIITFDGTTVAEIEQSFRAAVDEYLEDCARLGKMPNKSFSGRFNLRIPPELHRQAALLAARHHTSLNDLVEQAIRAAVEGNLPAPPGG